jgi:hypothetical protein
VGHNFSPCASSCCCEEVPEVGVRFRKGMSLAVISVDFLVDNIRDVESRAESVVCVTVTCLVYLYPMAESALALLWIYALTVQTVKHGILALYEVMWL